MIKGGLALLPFSTNLSVSYHGAGDLLGPSDLPRTQGAFGGEVKAQAVGGDQGAPLIGLPQDAPQGKVQDVRCRVVAHDWPTTTLGIGNANLHREQFKRASENLLIGRLADALPPRQCARQLGLRLVAFRRLSPRGGRSLLSLACS